MNKNLLTVQDVKDVLGMTRQGIAWNLREGNIEGAFKSGNKWLIPEENFIDWIIKTGREIEL